MSRKDHFSVYHNLLKNFFYHRKLDAEDVSLLKTVKYLQTSKYRQIRIPPGQSKTNKTDLNYFDVTILFYIVSRLKLHSLNHHLQ